MKLGQKVVLVVFASVGALSGCGSEERNALVAEASTTASGLPDLRFALPTIDVAVPGQAAPLVVTNGATFNVPCSTTGLRARYRYTNSGQSDAVAHKNQGQTAGGSTYTFAEGPLMVGSGRIAWISFGPITAVNTPVKLAIVLDTTPNVTETVESNNKWVAKVIRTCP